MGQNESHNSNVIKKAFDKLRNGYYEAIRGGLCKLLANAVVYALESHDENHQNHIAMGDNYGWLLMHNGQSVAMGVKASSTNEGQAKGMLNGLASTITQSGWIGIVMAGMRPVGYYAVDYERDILNGTMDYTKSSFNKYFKPLQ
ncbi:MAG: hypothetical protein WCS15_01325 [Prevotella sp.]